MVWKEPQMKVIPGIKWISTFLMLSKDKRAPVLSNEPTSKPSVQFPLLNLFYLHKKQSSSSQWEHVDSEKFFKMFSSQLLENANKLKNIRLLCPYSKAISDQKLNKLGNLKNGTLEFDGEAGLIFLLLRSFGG